LGKSTISALLYELSLTRLSSVIGQEGEQDGYYRSLLNLIPSANPFLTRSSGAFLFSLLNQNVVVPGSCPSADAPVFAALPVFDLLVVATPPTELVNQNVTFAVPAVNVTNGDLSAYSVVFINQQNVPITSPITNVQTTDGFVTFEAYFAFADLIAKGLTIAVVTKGAGPFASVPAVAAATVFGPGLIEL